MAFPGSPTRASETREGEVPREAEAPREADLPRAPVLSGLLFAAFVFVVLVEYLGLTADIPPLQASHAPTLLAWGMFAVIVLSLGPRVLVADARTLALLAFVIFSGASVTWAIVRTYVMTDLRSHADYFALFVAAAYLLDRPARIRRFSVVMTCVVLMLVARNLGSFFAEQRAGAFRAGYFVADGNDFGWTLVTLLLFPAYLVLSRQPMGLRLLGLAGCGAAVLGITGTASRGAALALGAAGIYYWLVLSRNRALTATVLGVALVVVMSLVPSAYLARLQTIGQYQDDSSAQGRLRAWRAATHMALDYPAGVGAGNFNSAYGRFYMPADASGWGAGRWISPHSVYFRTLGEYGFPGVALLLFLIGRTLRDNQALLRERRARPVPGGLDERWPAMLNLGLIGYAVGGLFLGGLTYPHLYLLAGLTTGCRRMMGPAPGEAEAATSEAAATGATKASAAAAARTAPALIAWQPPRRPHRIEDIRR